MLIGPFLDRYVAQDWVFQYNWSTAALVCLAVSCSLAVGVNLSQFACLGRFSAVSYQVPVPLHRHTCVWARPCSSSSRSSPAYPFPCRRCNNQITRA